MASVCQESARRLHKNEQHSQFSFACLETMYHSKMLCDLVLVADGKEVKAHKLVLASCSTAFYWKFSNDRSLNSIEMDDISYDTLCLIVEYLYKSEILISDDNVQDLLAAASTLVLRDLQLACRKFLKTTLNIGNCLGRRDIAKRFALPLVPTIDNYVGVNFPEVTNRGGFSKLTHDQAMDVIGSKALCAKESDILEGVLKWVTHDIGSRQDRVFSLLGQVRFPLIPQQYVFERFGKEVWLSSSPGFNAFSGDIFKCYFHKGATQFIAQPRQSLKQLCQIPKGCQFSEPKQPSKLLVVAGSIQKDCVYIEMYDFERNIWLKWPGVVNITSNSDSRLAVLGSRVYCIDGEQLQFIDMKDSNVVFKDCFPMLNHRLSNPVYSVACLSERIYALCIGRYAGNSSYYFSSQFVDTNIGVAKSMGDLLHKREHFGLGGVESSENLYAVGGRNINNRLSDFNIVECYKPSTNSWSQMPSMKYARSLPGVSSLDGKLYVVGGNRILGACKHVEVFNFSKWAWSQLPDMLQARAAPGVIAVNGLLYVVGGYNTENLKSIEVYNPRTNTWSMLKTSMTVGKSFVALGLVDRAAVNTSIK